MRIWIGVCLVLLASSTHAQQVTPDSSLGLSLTGKVQRDITRLGDEAERMTKALQRQTSQIVKRSQDEEAALWRQLQDKDSAATTVGAGIAWEYNDWQRKIATLTSEAAPLREYIPRLDSLQTMLRFLRGGSVIANLSAGQLSALQGLGTKLTALSASLQQSRELSDFLSQRQASLQEQLARFGLTKRLTDFKKQVYYYKVQLVQYKDALNDPSQLTSRIMALVCNQPAYLRYFQQHSYLASLFRLPGGDAPVAGKPLPGLQTREQTAALVRSRLGRSADISSALSGAGSSGAGNSNVGDGNSSAGDNPLAGSMQQARQQLDQWKTKLSQVGGTASSEPIPDFQPNPEHNKTFLHRLQLGFDVQTQNSRYYIPAISTLGLSLGYKLNSRSIVGVGAGYLLGWGQPFEHIALSSQGASLRSFLNWRLKGSFWLSGGAEMNYLNAFTTLSQLRKFSAWQSSALLGIIKQYKAGRRSGNVQLLFDALYQQHRPQSQPVLFRVGYTL